MRAGFGMRRNICIHVGVQIRHFLWNFSTSVTTIILNVNENQNCD